MTGFRAVHTKTHPQEPRLGHPPRQETLRVRPVPQKSNPRCRPEGRRYEDKKSRHCPAALDRRGMAFADWGWLFADSPVRG
jgi:hypothetical protein